MHVQLEKVQPTSYTKCTSRDEDCKPALLNHSRFQNGCAHL